MSESKVLKIEKYLVFEVKGKQYTIGENHQSPLFIDYQKQLKTGDLISFSKVLSYDDKFGSPYLENVEVRGEVVAHKRLKREVVLKYKAKKRTKKRSSFRVRSTEIKIVSVNSL